MYFRPSSLSLCAKGYAFFFNLLRGWRKLTSPELIATVYTVLGALSMTWTILNIMHKILGVVIDAPASAWEYASSSFSGLFLSVCAFGCLVVCSICAVNNLTFSTAINAVIVFWSAVHFFPLAIAVLNISAFVRAVTLYGSVATVCVLASFACIVLWHGDKIDKLPFFGQKIVTYVRQYHETFMLLVTVLITIMSLCVHDAKILPIWLNLFRPYAWRVLNTLPGSALDNIKVVVRSSNVPTLAQLRDYSQTTKQHIVDMRWLFAPNTTALIAGEPAYKSVSCAVLLVSVCFGFCGVDGMGFACITMVLCYTQRNHAFMEQLLSSLIFACVRKHVLFLCTYLNPETTAPNVRCLEVVSTLVGVLDKFDTTVRKVQCTIATLTEELEKLRDAPITTLTKKAAIVAAKFVSPLIGDLTQQSSHRAEVFEGTVNPLKIVDGGVFLDPNKSQCVPRWGRLSGWIVKTSGVDFLFKAAYKCLGY
jgi:hypothetical protein